MKKIIVFLLAVLTIAVVPTLFTSCEDSAGVYKPKKKISKVYEQKVGAEPVPNHLSEEWKWDGNKVSSISYYDESGFIDKENFIYDGDRITKIVDDQGNFAEYLYADKKFDKIKYCTPNGELLAEITFQYSKKKISVITFKEYDVNKNVISMIERGFIGRLLPKEGIQIVAKKLSNLSKETFVINLSYEGDNLLSITDGAYTYTFSDYDTHFNIWYNFFPFSGDEYIKLNVFSKNNPGKSILRYEQVNSTITHSYIYDGDFPITIQSFVNYDHDDDTYDYQRVYITRVEYY